MARRRNRNTRARRQPTPQGVPSDVTQVATAIMQERAEKASLTRQRNIINNRSAGILTRRTKGMGYPVNVPGRAEMVYNQLGSTDEGRLFSLINLHPCGEYVTKCCGIPDESQVSSVTPTFRGDSVVAISADYFINPPNLPSDFRYDIQLVVLPIPEVDYLFRVRVPSLNTGWSRWVVRRTSYFSSSGDGTSVGLAESGYSRARVVGRGITVHFDAPQLADQGRLIAGQIQAPHKVNDINVALESVNKSSDSTLPDPVDPVDTASVRRHILYLPQSETELTTQDVYAAQWEAKMGAYIPHRFVQPVQNFTNLETGRVSTVTSIRTKGDAESGPVQYNVSTTVPKTYFSIVDNAELRYSQDTAQQIFNSLDGAGNPDPRTWGYSVTPVQSGWDRVGSLSGLAESGANINQYGFWGGSELINHYTSVQFYLGIQNTSQLHIKTRLHLECEVHAQQSPVTPFIHKSPTIDEQAMHIVAYVAQNQAHVFFASDNDLSGILQSIGAILPGIARMASDSGVPFLSQLGKVVGVVGRGLKDLTSSF